MLKNGQLLTPRIWVKNTTLQEQPIIQKISVYIMNDLHNDYALIVINTHSINLKLSLTP